jgi:hypothetical protein
MEHEQDRWRRIDRHVYKLAPADPNPHPCHSDRLIMGVLLIRLHLETRAVDSRPFSLGERVRGRSEAMKRRMRF